MLRWRMLRHGAHHVNSPSLSGSSARPTSTRPRPRMRSISARSSGSWPIARGLRSFGMHVEVGARDVQVAAEDEPAARGARTARAYASERLEEAHLRREVLAAVRHVDRRDGQVADGRPRRCGSRSRTAGCVNAGARASDRLLHVQRDAGVALAAVPVAPVALEVAERRRDLVGRGLDLLQADDVRALARDPLLDLRLARADAVDVPGGDLHRRSDQAQSQICAASCRSQSRLERACAACRSAAGIAMMSAARRRAPSRWLRPCASVSASPLR